MFYPGQEVVCVDAKERENGPTGLVEGQHYTVLRMFNFKLLDLNIVGVFLVEVEAATFGGFYPDRFRPVEKKQTDISIFTEMLTPKKVVEPV